MMTDANQTNAPNPNGANNNNNNLSPQQPNKFLHSGPQTNLSQTSNPSSTTKPRLSLLSASKQSGMRINSDEQPEQQTITILSGPNEEFLKADSKVSESVKVEQPDGSQRNKIDNESRINSNNESANTPNTVQNNGRNTQLEEGNRMNISKEDLIRLFSMLKSELQSKEIALAAIKCEQLKRLINPVEISRSSLAKTYIELQDRMQRSRNQKSSLSQDHGSSSQSASKKHETNQRSASSDIAEYETKKKITNNLDDEESLNILNTLLELLDRHPLLALPRDSIYCLDYNCNELSTKNYLNLKIQHLDNLINQHRRYRYYMNERLKKSEQRYLELTHQLELERLLKSEIEKSAYKATGRAILLKHIDQLKEALEKERSDKQVIVMTLLNDLLDERERSQKLMRKIAELETQNTTTSSTAPNNNNSKASDGNGERLKKLEAEMSDLTMQLRKQSMSSIKEKNELESRNTELTNENLALKANIEQLEAKLAMKSANNSRPKEATQSVSPPSPGRTGNNPAIPTNKTLGSPTSVSSRAPGLVKSSPPGKVSSPSSGSPHRGSSVETGSVLVIGGPSKLITSTQKPNAPQISSRIVSNNSNNNESQTIRIQPLFKAGNPVMSANQQARNLKPSISAGGIGVSSGSGGSLTGGVASPPRLANSNNQTVTKPRVPAKPAQLLDQQRNSVN